jgi:hypothetical protein
VKEVKLTKSEKKFVDIDINSNLACYVAISNGMDSQDAFCNVKDVTFNKVVYFFTFMSML